MVLLLFPLLFLALGAALGTWWLLAAPVVVSAGVTGFLIINDGWYGAGWGDFGVEFNLLVAALSVLGAAAGVAFRKSTSEPREKRT